MDVEKVKKRPVCYDY